jgi:hypothetical protein
MNAPNNVLALTAVALCLSGITTGAWLAEVAPAAASSDQTALTATAAWLAEVDAGHYAASWDRAAELFRNAIKKAQWEQQLGAARAPFGALVSRQVRSSQRAKSLPGAPDGDYLVIEYAAAFEHKQQAVETVTAMLEKDGQWRVAGYFIR